MTNVELYKELPKVTLKVQQRRMRPAGHCIRHDDEVASKLVLWQPTEGRRSRGRRRLTYVDTLLEDTGVESTQKLKNIMKEQVEWKKCVEAVWRPGGRPR